MNTQQAKVFFARDRFAARAGIEILEAQPGYCRAMMHIEDHHKNSADVVQGGAIFTLADLAFAVAANSHGQLALAINGSISFLKGATDGTLYATATEVTKPTRIGAYDVLITDDDDQVIASFSGMVYRKRERLPADEPTTA